MKLHALQSAQINLPGKGLLMIRGPEYNDRDELLQEGEQIEVPDDFVVNTDVFRIVDGPKNPTTVTSKQIAIATPAPLASPPPGSEPSDDGDGDPQSGGRSKGKPKATASS